LPLAVVGIAGKGNSLKRSDCKFAAAGWLARSGAGSESPAQTVIAFGETLADPLRGRQVPGGAPLNVACHLGALGAHPVLVTRTGKDALGDALVQAMSERGLDLRGVQRDPARLTGRLKVTEHADGHRFDILPDQAYDHIHAGLARMVALSAHPAMIYFGTLAQRGESRRALREVFCTVDSRVFLDVNLCEPWVDPDTLGWSLQRAGVVKLNEHELARIAELFSLAGDTPLAHATVLMTRFGLQRLVVTCGAAGAWTLDATGRLESVSDQAPPQVVDTEGAGDGFAAVFMLGLLRGWTPADTLARADAFARALCGIRGAVPDAPDFYAPFIHDWQLATQGGACVTR
jgi:fructokinase